MCVCVCVDFCLCLLRWVSGFLRFDGGWVCVFVWIFVCVCSDEFLGFKDLMVLCVCVCSDGFLCLF